LRSRVLSNQVEYSLVNRSPEVDLLPFAEAHDRVIIAYSPLAQGLLSGRYHGTSRPTDSLRTAGSYFRPENIQRTMPLITVLREVAHAHSASPAQIALAWAIQNPVVAAIPGAFSIEQLEENAAAAEIQLAEDEYLALQSVSAWSRDIAPPDASFRGKLTEVKHCAGIGRYWVRNYRTIIPSS
jgi:aryl-alcohol dehydrogenase-like predicted oxidoreductase